MKISVELSTDVPFTLHNCLEENEDKFPTVSQISEEFLEAFKSQPHSP